MKLQLSAAALALAFALPAQSQTQIQWWHAMSGPLGEWVNDLAKEFNASQKDYVVVPTYKGSYGEAFTAAMAAYRAGNAPDILQVYEVGTATMMAAKGADQTGRRSDDRWAAPSSTPRSTSPRWPATTRRRTARC